MTEVAFGDPRLSARFWDKVVVADDGCWVWQGAKIRGYALFSRDGYKLGHRYAYAMANGGIPRKMVCDHLCRNPSCVNPNHIEAVTNAVNTLRGASGLRGKDLPPNKEAACVRGHPRTEENTMIRKDGQRECLVCHRERMRVYLPVRRALIKARAALDQEARP